MAQTRKSLMGKPLNNLQGFRFGSLTVLQLGEKQRPMKPLAWVAEGNTPLPAEG